MVKTKRAEIKMLTALVFFANRWIRTKLLTWLLNCTMVKILLNLLDLERLRESSYLLVSWRKEEAEQVEGRFKETVVQTGMWVLGNHVISQNVNLDRRKRKNIFDIYFYPSIYHLSIFWIMYVTINRIYYNIIIINIPLFSFYIHQQINDCNNRLTFLWLTFF